MALKDILVFVDGSSQSANTARAACSLALRHDAHVNGMTISREPDILGYAGVKIPESAMEIIKRQRQEAADKARAIFDKAVKSSGMSDRNGWSVASGSLIDTLSLRSRYADLTVISQDRPEEYGGGSGLVDDLIMASGRPVMVIPFIGAPDEIGRKVLIAWNGSREAARAVSDAMPILETAESIEVFAVEPEGLGELPGADIATHLAHHGLKTEVSKTAGLDIDVGDVLLNQVADGGADLIVMGAYGHSRMRELVLGGATRHILEHMTVPVLLSH